MSDLEKIKAYISYLEKYKNQYCNAFEVLNTSENSFSEFIAWLCDIKDKNNEESIQYYFFKRFLKKLWENEQKDTNIDEKNKTLSKEITEEDFDKFFDKFIKKYTVKTQKENMDIVITSESSKFVIVIENKIAAKISAKDNYTQIENYTRNTNFEYDNKKFVFICANKEFYPEQPLKNHIAQKNYQGEFKDKKIKDLLYGFGYSILEHFDIAIILYKFLREKANNLFENDILIPTEYDEMLNTVKKIYNENGNKKKTEIQIEQLINYLNSVNDKKQRILYKDLKNKKPIRSVTLPIRKVLENSEYVEKRSIVCQYIEFCELHNGKVDNFQAYTKIINGEPVWNICERIFENKAKWQELKVENKKLKNQNIEELSNILNGIENIKNQK